MKAAVLYALNKPLIIEDLEIPHLKRGQVLVKILCSGVCHTQINELKGIKGIDKYLPHTLGHEASGVVEDIGIDVKRVKVGDYVTLHWMKGSGIDAGSTEYLSGTNKIHSGAITTFSEYAVISENRMTKIPKDVPPDVASVLGCAVLTGGGMVKNDLKTNPDNTIAVFGVGGLGLSAVLLASSIGCSTIIAVDIKDDKLRLAQDCGATHAVNTSEGNQVDKIREITGNGVDQAVEASGVNQVIEEAFQSIKPGGTLVFAANVVKGSKICLDPWDLINGKKIVGTYGGSAKPDKDIPYYVDLYLKGKLNVEKLITDNYKLEEINQSFEGVEEGKVGRAIIWMQ